jgi:mannosyltransferase
VIHELCLSTLCILLQPQLSLCLSAGPTPSFLATAAMLIRTRLRFLRWLPHRLLSHWKIISFVICLIIFELIYHINSLSVIRPPTNLDPPFYTGCQNPVLNTSARANATLMMLARNSDVDGAVASVESVQQQFNANFGYPWVFLNNEEWSEEFINKVTKAGKGADMRFETIPTGMWGYPAWIDQKKARRSMDNMKNQGIMYAGAESYHHMCRFQSG